MDKRNFSQVAAAAFGALIFSATCIGTAIAPARAIETAPAVVAQAAPGSSGQAHA